MAPAGPLAVHGPAEFPCDFGGYRLIGLLGRGGMGVVYEAEERATGRRLALKVLGRQLDTPEMRQRFLREGRLAARINHLNSLYVFGSEEIDDLPVITMEIAGGGTLRDVLKQRGPLPVTEAVDAILDVIAGLESAQAAGVLHRDIKPSNCFVAPDGAVKVGDFGLSVSTLARTDNLLTEHGEIMGTPAFASPEQLRGDALDVRADIYSVGATLFTLLTNRAPFEGDNAVQVVANAVNQKPPRLAELRSDVPADLARAVARCLAKEPEGRYTDYASLRDVLLPYSSRVPVPATIKSRSAAGWIDYLVALLPPYVALMLLVGADGLFVRPLVERTLYSLRYYALLFALGCVYFTLMEGIWGAGLGKWLMGLRVARPDGRRPGIGRALLRFAIPVACCEGVRMPAMYAFILTAEWTSLQTTVFVLAAVVCGWIPILLTLLARRGDAYVTIWDRASGTQVIRRLPGSTRMEAYAAVEPSVPDDGREELGPFQVVEVMVPNAWIVARDAKLRRNAWLLRRHGQGPTPERQAVARISRLRWLQHVQTGAATWDAYEAPAGVPFASLIADGKRIPWRTMRCWLSDIAAEFWAAAADHTLPADLSMDQVWIGADGRAILLDEPWPAGDAAAGRIAVDDIAGQQRFLSALAAHVERTGVPLHAHPVLRNLSSGKFEKLSFVAGTLRGLLDRPADVSRGIRAGSIFVLPVYVWIALLVGRYHDKPWDSPAQIIALSALVVLAGTALANLLAVPFRCTISQSVFRLAVIDAKGMNARRSRMLGRWSIVWLPLLLPIAAVALLTHGSIEPVTLAACLLIPPWIAAAIYAVIYPHRGLHDRLANTWVVRR